MNTIVERITEAIKDILINFIQSGMEDMFVEVNNKVGTIAAQVGQTPQGWNGSVFSLIKNLSETVMVPIAGMIITFVLCYELITMVTQKNNFHEFETFNIFIWVFKAYIAIYLVTNTFNITMAVFDVGQHVVNGAAGVISGSTEIDATTAITNLLDTMEDMEVGELVHVIADCHIYDRHVPVIKELISRTPYPAPTVKLNPNVKNFYDFTTDDLIVENYQTWPQIKNIPIAI